MYLYLCKVFVKLDQPLRALEYYTKGLDKFPKDKSLLTGMARIHEALNDNEQSINYYKNVLKTDNTSVEAIACIATHHFYGDQPEIALSYYRRLLQMGVYNAELFNNLGLCCYFAQQYDFALTCFQKALALGSSQLLADIWYNIGIIAIGTGDTKLAYRCYKLSLTHDNNHSEAYNNLGVLEWQRQRGEKALACYQSSLRLSPHLYEPHYNIALASQKIGRLQDSYKAAKLSLEAYPDHIETQELLKQLHQHFAAL
jgi:tetratricopeptide repeat protein 8